MCGLHRATAQQRRGVLINGAAVEIGGIRIPLPGVTGEGHLDIVYACSTTLLLLSLRVLSMYHVLYPHSNVVRAGTSTTSSESVGVTKEACLCILGIEKLNSPDLPP